MDDPRSAVVDMGRFRTPIEGGGEALVQWHLEKFRPGARYELRWDGEVLVEGRADRKGELLLSTPVEETG